MVCAEAFAMLVLDNVDGKRVVGERKGRLFRNILGDYQPEWGADMALQIAKQLEQQPALSVADDREHEAIPIGH